MSSILTQASHQWATRPDDERYTSLVDMKQHFDVQREQSRAIKLSTRRVDAEPTEDNKGIVLLTEGGEQHAPTHFAFGQLAQRAEAPAGYLRTLPAPIAADCINYGLKYKRDVEDIGMLLQDNGQKVARAVTGPNYGRIWNNDITGELIKRFGDGVNGRFKVPGEFGKDVVVSKANTTLFAGDRDMFVFLADEKNRIEIADRRNGEAGTLARGFFVWNSEVGNSTFGIATFLFDYVCMNRIVWGAKEYKQITIRHTAGAPDRYIEEITPALISYSDSSTKSIVEAVEKAKAARIDNVDEFLAKRFSRRMATVLQDVHKLEEGKPIETLWDAATAVTAHARSVTWQDQRVELEAKGGELLDLAQ